MKGKRKPVRIQRGVYAMEMADGAHAEITMYGKIVRERPVDGDGQPKDGEYIVQGEFLRDIDAVGRAQTLTIRMNSLGGSVGAAILIHNRLRELAAGGMDLTCVVDGVAASGGSVIACACDRVEVNPSSLIMVHNCWGDLRGGYNASELREMATEFDAYDKAMVAIYARKTGLPEQTLEQMMRETTYLTGEEAVAKGFADALVPGARPLQIAASADGQSLFVDGKEVIQLMPGTFAPDGIPTVKPEALAPVDISKDTPGEAGGQNGGNTMAKTLEELRAENPELAEALLAEARDAVSGAEQARADAAAQADAAVQAERKRLEEIDAIAALYDGETVKAAKYGESACTARDLAYRAAQEAVKRGAKLLKDMEADTQASGAQNVSAAADSTPEGAARAPRNEAERMAQAKAAVKAVLDGGKEET